MEQLRAKGSVVTIVLASKGQQLLAVTWKTRQSGQSSREVRVWRTTRTTQGHHHDLPAVLSVLQGHVHDESHAGGKRSVRLHHYHYERHFLRQLQLAHELQFSKL